MITLPTSVTTELDSPTFKVATLVNLPGTGFTVTDNHKDITYNSVTYAADGELLLKTSNVSRTEDIAANTYTIVFSGADQSAYQEYSGNTHIGKEATVYLAFLDSNYDLAAVDSVVEMYTGIVNAWDLAETAGSSELSIQMTSHWSAFEINKGRSTNSSSQQELYAGDEIFKFAFQEKLQLKWGT